MENGDTYKPQIDDDSLEWIRESLVESDRQRCASRVLGLESEAAVGKGDNYCSEMQRLRVRTVLHSGELHVRHLMYKAVPPSPTRKIMMKKFGAFIQEAKMYQNQLPLMDEIRRQYETMPEPLWPRIYGVKKNLEAMLFEDLTAQGFKMANRLKGLDYDHCLLALQALGKFHALGAVMNKNGDMRVKDFYPPYFSPDPDAYQMPIFRNFDQIADVVERKWGKEWSHYPERLRKLNDTVPPAIYESRKLDETKFCTLNHGDFWLNNMLFRCDRQGRPTSIRMVDFQLCHFNHPGFDLQYFLQTSPDFEAKDRKTELIREYHTSLAENLRLYGFPETGIPSLNEIEEGYRSCAVYGMAVGMAIAPIMLIPSDEALNAAEMEEFCKDAEKREKVSFVRYDYDGEDFIKHLKRVIKESDELGLL